MRKCHVYNQTNTEIRHFSLFNTNAGHFTTDTIINKHCEQTGINKYKTIISTIAL